MKRLIPFTAALILLGMSCNRPLVCTQELRHIIINMEDTKGNRLIPDNYKVILLRTNEDITQNQDSATVILTSDAHVEKFRKKGDDLKFTANIGSKSVERIYKVGTDGCHVELKSGDTRIVVP